MDVLLSVYRFCRSRHVSTSIALPTSITSNIHSDSGVSDVSDEAVLWKDRRIVRVTGGLVHSDILSKALWFIGTSIQGRHVRTIAVVSQGCYGVAVNNDETVMSVARTDSRIEFLSLPAGKVLRTVGSYGGGSLQFSSPYRLCFNAAGDSVLVADFGNNRVQEITINGEYKRSIAVTDAVTVRCNSDGRLIGVGTARHPYRIEILDYDTGAVVRSITGQFKGQVDGIAFSPDSSQLAVMSYYHTSVKLLRFDGTFIRDLASEVSSGSGWKDVCFTTSGEIVSTVNGEAMLKVNGGIGSEPLHQRVILMDSSKVANTSKFMASTICAAGNRVYVAGHTGSAAVIVVYE